MTVNIKAMQNSLRNIADSMRSSSTMPYDGYVLDRIAADLGTITVSDLDHLHRSQALDELTRESEALGLYDA